MSNERVPPHDESAEKAIIGAVLGYGRKALSIVGSVDIDIFYFPAHREVWEAIKKLDARDIEIDIISVGDELKRMGMANRFDDGWIQWASKLASDAGLYYQTLRNSVAIILSKFRLRKLIELAVDIAARAYQDQSDDEVMDIARSGIAQLEIAGSRTGPVRLGDKLGDVLQVIEDRARGDKTHSVSTRISTIDYVVGGLMPGNLVVIGARPGVGKTAFMDCIAHGAAFDGIPTLIFSIEMMFQEIAERILSLESNVPTGTLKFPKGDPRPQNRGANALDIDGWKKLHNASERLRAIPLTIDERPLRIGQIVGESRKWHAREVAGKKELGLICVDYAQIIGVDSNLEKLGREQQVSGITSMLKRLAKSLAVPIIILSQLNRECEKLNRAPIISDLRESGAIEQDADIIILLHRDMDPDDPSTLLRPHQADGIVGKNRNGRTGIAPLIFQPSTMRYVARDDNAVEPQGMCDEQ